MVSYTTNLCQVDSFEKNTDVAAEEAAGKAPGSEGAVDAPGAWYGKEQVALVLESVLSLHATGIGEGPQGRLPADSQEWFPLRDGGTI